MGARDEPFGSSSAQAPRDRVEEGQASGQTGAVELLLQPRPAAMGLAEFGDQAIDLGGMLGPAANLRILASLRAALR